MATTKHLKVAVIGPKGQCGCCIVNELLSRGHSVVGISRTPPPKWPTPGKYSSIPADLHNSKYFSEVLSQGFDAIVCAYGPPLCDLSKVYTEGVEAHARIKRAWLASSHEGSFIVIGGAGSLHVRSGGDFVDEPDFPFQQWYDWPDSHLKYMRIRARDHGSSAFATFIRIFQWARNNIEHPGWLSWILRPAARLYMRHARKLLVQENARGLITASRIALRMYEGVTEKRWSFLSPPWLLRDKGIRTGKYKKFIDTAENPAHEGIEGGIYNEDMAVAIVDELENPESDYKHWTCTGSIDLKEW